MRTISSLALLIFVCLMGFGSPKPGKPILIKFTEVPETLAAKGYGAEELAASLAQSLDSMAFINTHIWLNRGDPQSLPEIVLAKSKNYSEENFGKIVTATLRQIDGQIVLELNLKNTETKKIWVKSFSEAPSNVSQLLSQASEKLLKELHPYSHAVYLYNKGQHKEALDELNEITKTNDPDSAPFAYNLLGIDSQGSGNNINAIGYFEKATKLWPGYSNAFANMGKSYFKLERNTSGTEMMEKAVQTDPHNWFTYEVWSEALLDQKKYKEAEEKCRKDLELRPQNWVALNRLGSILKSEDKDEEAVLYYAKAAELNPEGYIYYNWALSLLGLRKYSEAEEKINLALKYDPNDLDSLDTYGLIYIYEKQYDKAIEKFEECLKIYPGYEAAQKHILWAQDSKREEEKHNSH